MLLSNLVPSFIKTNPGLALYAFMAVAASGFGQTFFVSVMGGEIRSAFDLSHTAYGSLYSAATLLSAALVLRLGGLADTWPLSRATLLAAVCLAAGCLIIGTASGLAALGMGFLLIRFGGQGYMTHLGMTTAARYFPTGRGKAVAMAAAGFPFAEATLPAAAVLVMGALGWRWAWIGGAALLVIVIYPLLWSLSRNVVPPVQDRRAGSTESTGEGFTRERVLRDRGFYMILPATVITPFLITAILFHQVAIASIQDWSLQTVAKAFSGYATGHLLSLAVAGFVVDRLGAGRALPLSLTPMIISLTLLGIFSGSWVPMAYLTLVGITQGFAATSVGAIWAERYGFIHLGAIRSMAHAIMVVATAAAPVLLGLLLDMGVTIKTLALCMASGVVGVAVLAALAPRPTSRSH